MLVNSEIMAPSGDGFGNMAERGRVFRECRCVWGVCLCMCVHIHVLCVYSYVWVGAYPMLGIYSEEMKSVFQRVNSPPMFIVLLLTIVRRKGYH